MALFRKKTAKPEAPAITPTKAATPVISLILADVAVRAGQTVLRQSIERKVMEGKTTKGRIVRGRTLGDTVVSTILFAVARRSLPGAILVGGGLLAKSLSDRQRNRQRVRKARAAKDVTESPKPNPENTRIS